MDKKKGLLYRDIIPLWNRDNLKTELVSVNGCELYTLRCEIDMVQIYKYPDGTICAIDPPGGPLIHRGFQVCDGTLVVSDIDWKERVGFLLTLEEYKH